MQGEVGGRRGGEGGGVGRNPTALPGGQPHEGVSPAVSQVVRRQVLVHCRDEGQWCGGST